jgi:ribose transport system ATP-binding protein
MSDSATASVPRLRAERLGKTYGSFRALRDVAFDVRPGEIHGLVGQNGSGKSTLIKILTGYHAPDVGGSLEVDGAGVGLPLTARERHRHGISVVHQSLGLLPELSVTENVRIEQHEPSRWMRRVSWRHEAEKTREALERLGSDIEPGARVADLSAEQRAIVAIARAMQNLTDGGGLIVFDESTRPLTKDALGRFYAVLGTVLAQGTSVLMISHRLEEVLQHTDRVSVLRDGRLVVAGAVTDRLTERELVTTMLGRELGSLVERDHDESYASDRSDLIRVENLSGPLVDRISFSIAPGEIVGITGLIGSGFEQVPYLLTGAQAAESGDLTIDGSTYGLTTADVRAAIERGIFLIPEERAARGLSLDMSVEENITLPRLHSRGRPFWSGQRWRHAEVSEMIDTLDIQPPAGDAIVGTLSGGNQQKVLLAKWLAAEPRLLVMHEPAQAVDVGARLDIVTATRSLAARGAAVIVAATDPSDLAALCSRVIVLHEGRIVDELAGNFDQDQIIQATFAEYRSRRARERRPRSQPRQREIAS